MSSLAVVTPANPQARIDSLERDLYQRNREIADLREELRIERGKTAQMESGVKGVRDLLSPLYKALRLTFGEIDAMGLGEAQPVNAPKNAAAWEQWKQRLGGATARAIDALMLHGEMTQGQLRIILGCATRTAQNVVASLSQAKLIDKNNGKIRLKEL